MGLLKTDPDAYDQSMRAAQVLDYVLEDDPLNPAVLSGEAESPSPNAAAVPVTDELRRHAVLQFESDRQHARVLVVSSDLKLLDVASPERAEMVELGKRFAELHVCVMGPRVPHKANRERVANNVWFYPVSGWSRWFVYWNVFRTLERELVFGGRDGFRPDVVVGRDVFEAGMAAYAIARHYHRSLQLHILENIFSAEFQAQDPYHKRHDRSLRFLLRRVTSVRTATAQIETAVRKRFTRVTDLAVLPRYYHIAEIVRSVGSTPRVPKYPQFSFTFLYVGTLNAESALYRAIDAVRSLLYTPSIGLIVIGDGPLRTQFEERAKLLGIHKQVIFKPRTDDILAELHGVDMLICTDTDTDSDNLIIEAAAAGLPIIMARSAFRDEIFTDGVDAYLCDPNDTIEFSQKATRFLNTTALRTQFSVNVQDTIRSRIEESPEHYYETYRDTVEYVLHVDALALAKKTATAVKPQKKRFSLFARTSESVPADISQPLQPTSATIDGVEIKLPNNS